MARAALRQGGTAPAVLNAANEVAVAAFLGGELPFPGIERVIAETLEREARDPGSLGTLADVLEADARGRAWAREVAKYVAASHRC
jgi:1-deoxy-D-xylulose-5-phosphate reductoisomerase